MEKKIYEKPAMQLEMFVANHYVAACYHVDCKTDKWNSDYKYLYLDTHYPYGQLDSGDECVVRNKSFHGCGIQHTGVLSDTALAFNAFVSTNSSSNQQGSTTTPVYAWQIPDPDDKDFNGWHVCYNPTDAERQDTSRPNAS